MKNFHFGKNLRYIRVINAISQQTMAQQIGISQSVYSRIERGKKIPSHQLAVKIAKAAGVPIANLQPKKRLGYKAKEILASPLGTFFIIACFSSLYPDAWGITDRLCSYFEVSEDTTNILRRLTIPTTVFLMWCGVTIVKGAVKIPSTDG